MTGALPEDVRGFLLDCIESVEQLEVLLLLHGSPQTAWSPEAVARVLYSNPSSIAQRLASLQAHKIIVNTDPPSTYQYQPRSPALDATVTRVAEMYRERRVAVITLIASKPMENVRAFSDAFRLRKKDKD